MRASRKDFLIPIKRQGEIVPFFPFVCNHVRRFESRQRKSMAKKILDDLSITLDSLFCEITNNCYLSQIELRVSGTLN